MEAAITMPGLQERRNGGFPCSAGLGRRIVALSGGKDSTAMALRLAEAEPAEYEYCITPTGRELPVMLDHWAKLECLLGKPLTRIPGPSLIDRIKHYKALPNFRMRYCTREVKIEPFMAYVAANSPAVCYVGIRADEVEDREGTNWNGVEGITQDLREQFEAGNIPKGAAQTTIPLHVAERSTMCAWCAR